MTFAEDQDKNVFYSSNEIKFTTVTNVKDIEDFFSIKAIGVDTIVCNKKITLVFSQDTLEYIGILHPNLPIDTIERCNRFAKLFRSTKLIGTSLYRVNYVLNHPDLRDNDKRYILDLISKYNIAPLKIKSFFLEGIRYVNVDLGNDGYIILINSKIWLSSYHFPN